MTEPSEKEIAVLLDAVGRDLRAAGRAAGPDSVPDALHQRVLDDAMALLEARAAVEAEGPGQTRAFAPSSPAVAERERTAPALAIAPAPERRLPVPALRRGVAVRPAARTARWRLHVPAFGGAAAASMAACFAAGVVFGLQGAPLSGLVGSTEAPDTGTILVAAAEDVGMLP